MPDASTVPNRKALESCPNCGESGVAYPGLAYYLMDPNANPPPMSDDPYDHLCHIGTLADRLPGRKVIHP